MSKLNNSMFFAKNSYLTNIIEYIAMSKLREARPNLRPNSVVKFGHQIVCI